MRTALVPAVNANAYVHVRSPGDLAFSSGTLGIKEFKLTSAGILLSDKSDEMAGRFVTNIYRRDAPPDVRTGLWSEASSTDFRFGPNSRWGQTVRDTWNQESSRTFAEQFPGAWRDLQSMPEHAPAPPIAAGFIRNFGQLVENLIGKAGVNVAGLASGLSLARIDRIAFVAYADDISHLTEETGPNMLRDLDVSILALADSPYPSIVVGGLFDGFASSMGFSQISIAGFSAYQHGLNDNIHVVLLHNDATLFFAIASSNRQARALINSVITTQD